MVFVHFLVIKFLSKVKIILNKSGANFIRKHLQMQAWLIDRWFRKQFLDEKVFLKLSSNFAPWMKYKYNLEAQSFWGLYFSKFNPHVSIFFFRKVETNGFVCDHTFAYASSINMLCYHSSSTFLLLVKLWQWLIHCVKFSLKYGQENRITITAILYLVYSLRDKSQ